MMMLASRTNNSSRNRKQKNRKTQLWPKTKNVIRLIGIMVVALSVRYQVKQGKGAMLLLRQQQATSTTTTAATAAATMVASSEEAEQGSTPLATSRAASSKYLLYWHGAPPPKENSMAYYAGIYEALERHDRVQICHQGALSKCFQEQQQQAVNVNTNTSSVESKQQDDEGTHHPLILWIVFPHQLSNDETRLRKNIRQVQKALEHLLLMQQHQEQQQQEDTPPFNSKRPVVRIIATLFLNKAYKKRDEKVFPFVQAFGYNSTIYQQQEQQQQENQQFSYSFRSSVFTWSPRAPEFQKQYNIPFHASPFAIDVPRFDVSSLPAQSPSSINIPIDCDIFIRWDASPLKYRFRQEIDELVPTLRKHPYNWTIYNPDKFVPHEEYLYALRDCKFQITTIGMPGELDLIGTRYFEVMAAGTSLLLAEKGDDVGSIAYDPDVLPGMVQEETFVSFESIQELLEKITYYKQHPEKIKPILERASQWVQQQTWDSRATRIVEYLDNDFRQDIVKMEKTKETTYDNRGDLRQGVQPKEEDKRAPDYSHTIPQEHNWEQRPFLESIAATIPTCTKMNQLSETEHKEIFHALHSELNTKVWLDLDWQVLNEAGAHRSTCGKQKCFFPSRSHTGLGYVVAQKEAFLPMLKVQEVANKLRKYPGQLLELPDQTPVLVNISKPMACLLASYTDQPQHPPDKKTKLFNPDKHSTVVVHKVIKAPKPNLLLKSSEHFDSVKNGWSKFTKKVNKTAAFLNLNHQINGAIKAFKEIPQLIYDFQGLVDQKGNFYHIDLDRVSSRTYPPQVMAHDTYKFNHHVPQILLEAQYHAGMSFIEPHETSSTVPLSPEDVPDYDHSLPGQHNWEQRPFSESRAATIETCQQMNQYPDVEKEKMLADLDNELNQKEWVDIDWQVQNQKGYRRAPCGKHKCFFPSRSHDKLGYVVAHRKAYRPMQKVQEVVTKLQKYPGRLLELPNQSPALVNISQPLACLLATYTSQPERPIERKSVVFDPNDKHRMVVVHKVIKAPEPHILMGHASEKFDTFQKGWSTLVNEHHATLAFWNLHRDIHGLVGAFAEIPELLVDFQGLVDQQGHFYHMDLDRVYGERYSKSEIRYFRDRFHWYLPQLLLEARIHAGCPFLPCDEMTMKEDQSRGSVV